jgi:hypothetical protein
MSFAYSIQELVDKSLALAKATKPGVVGLAALAILLVFVGGVCASFYSGNVLHANHDLPRSGLSSTFSHQSHDQHEDQRSSISRIEPMGNPQNHDHNHAGMIHGVQRRLSNHELLAKTKRSHLMMQKSSCP